MKKENGSQENEADTQKVEASAVERLVMPTDYERCHEYIANLLKENFGDRKIDDAMKDEMIPKMTAAFKVDIPDIDVSVSRDGDMITITGKISKDLKLEFTGV